MWKTPVGGDFKRNLYYELIKIPELNIEQSATPRYNRFGEEEMKTRKKFNVERFKALHKRDGRLG